MTLEIGNKIPEEWELLRGEVEPELAKLGELRREPEEFPDGWRLMRDSFGEIRGAIGTLAHSWDFIFRLNLRTEHTLTLTPYCKRHGRPILRSARLELPTCSACPFGPFATTAGGKPYSFVYDCPHSQADWAAPRGLTEQQGEHLRQFVANSEQFRQLPLLEQELKALHLQSEFAALQSTWCGGLEKMKPFRIQRAK